MYYQLHLDVFIGCLIRGGFLNRKIIVNSIGKNLTKDSGWYNTKITYKNREVCVWITSIEVNEELAKFNLDDLQNMNVHHMTKYVFKVNGNLVAIVSWINPNNTYIYYNWKYTDGIDEFYSIIHKINKIRRKESRLKKRQQNKEFYKTLKHSDSFYDPHYSKEDTSDDE